ncbi:MAG: MBL fold metallo-hydrolase [Thalassobaculaceae bacterium]|nr:MBL fold metallo-hydrolase [Thalassobaculaceae bacterium]
MEVTFVGCGDAFGSGGRYQTCFHVAAARTRFLIDCGASSLAALKRLGIDRNAIETILVTHFHADHFGGIPFFMLDAQFFARRRAPLTIAGPPGLGEWVTRAMETAFPGSSRTVPKFELTLVELEPDRATEIGGVSVTPTLVVHGPPGEPFFAYRVTVDGKVLAYTGDTEWVEGLVEVGRDADLFIAEAYFFDKTVPYHLDLKTLVANLDRIRPRRLILTHMNEDMLARVAAGEVVHEVAEDGKTITV